MRMSRGFIHNCQKLQTIQISISWLTDNKAMDHIPTMEKYSLVKKELTDISNNMDESPMSCAK